MGGDASTRASVTTVVGLSQSIVDAQQSILDLIDAGFDRRCVSFVMAKERTVHAVDGASGGVVVDDGSVCSITCTSGERRGALVAGPLAASGRARPVPGSDRTVTDIGLADAIGAGAILVAVRCEDRRAICGPPGATTAAASNTAITRNGVWHVTA